MSWVLWEGMVRTRHCFSRPERVLVILPSNDSPQPFVGARGRWRFNCLMHPVVCLLGLGGLWWPEGVVRPWLSGNGSWHG